MTTEWGVWNSEGCIESQLWTEGEAQIALAHWYAEGERRLSIDQICTEHEEQPASTCEQCFAEPDEDDKADKSRYFQAMHGVQSAILFEQSTFTHPYHDQAQINKDTRVGIDSAHISNGALVELLVEKGLITLDEYEAKLASFAERELLRYETKHPRLRFR